MIGQSTRDGAQPPGDPVGTPNHVATILERLLDLSTVRLQTDLPTSLRHEVSSFLVSGLMSQVKAW